MRLLTILTILLLVTTAHAQTPENDALFGTFNVRNDAARICLATAGPSGAPWCWSSMGFEWHNGPPGEETYLNHTSGFSYNSHFNGTKIIPGLVNYTLSTESKFRNGKVGEPGHFMTEFHLNWCNPDGSICVRPLDAAVQYDTGNFNIAVRGKMNFFRHASNGGAQWGIWHEDGYLDLTKAPEGTIGFKNNHRGLRWATASGVNSVAPLYVDDQNRVVIGGRADVVIDSPKVTYTTPICGAISDSDGSQEGNTRVLNALLQCMRTSGQLAQTPPSAKSELPVCVGDESTQVKPASVQVKRSKRNRLRRF